MPSPTIIEVFPNTGHHYFEIPLTRIIDRSIDDLELIVKSNRGKWREWGSYIPWVRFKYDLNLKRESIVRICIETNLGSPSRGILFAVDEGPLCEIPDEDDDIPFYAANDEADLQAQFKGRVTKLPGLPTKDGSIESDIRIIWKEKGGRHAVDVDLVVDLGNTRSVALLLEHPAQRESIKQRIQILKFIPRGHSYSDNDVSSTAASVLDDDCSVIDSWLLLHETTFNHQSPHISGNESSSLSSKYEELEDEEGYSAKHYLPHSFAEISPALIGGGRKSPEGAYKIFGNLNDFKYDRFYLSSPKRYAWDEESQGTHGSVFWNQIKNTDGEDDLQFGAIQKLSGLFSRFMEPGGADYAIDENANEDDYRHLPSTSADPTYPRRDAVCWFALSILESAYRQINSDEYLRKAGRAVLPRRLHGVRVTFPSGWTGEERDKYLAQWERAINLFTLTRFEDLSPCQGLKGMRPVLCRPLIDEAVASQLPIIYSDITALGNRDLWLDLYGQDGKLTVMNLDVGGGTSDLSVINYSRYAGDSVTTHNSQLFSKLLFRDGFAVGGDMLVKRIIERMLIPAWLETSIGDQFEIYTDAQLWIKRFFLDPGHPDFQQVDPMAGLKLARITRLVFIPIVNRWLGNICGSNESGGHFNVEEGLKDSLIDQNALNSLNELVSEVIRQKDPRGASLKDHPFKYDSSISLHCPKEKIEQCIEEVFADFSYAVGSLVSKFECQMVIISGKPSELPKLQDLLKKAFPLPFQRIIKVKNFPAGSWYPFSSVGDGRIMDAKTCTVVGAALYQDIQSGNLDGVNITNTDQTGAPPPSYWGVIKKGRPSSEFYIPDNLLFTPEDASGANTSRELQSAIKTIEVDLPCRIGRQLLRMPTQAAQPVYEIRFRKGVEHNAGFIHRAKVRLQWVSDTDSGERLNFLGADPVAECPDLQVDKLEMSLNTLLDDSFWLDRPTFDIQ